MMAKGLPRSVAKTATKVSVQSIAALTGAFGTTGNAIVDVTSTPTQTTVNNNFRVLEDKINAILAALKL
jgi:hypothetical protein